MTCSQRIWRKTYALETRVGGVRWRARWMEWDGVRDGRKDENGRAQVFQRGCAGGSRKVSTILSVVISTIVTDRFRRTRFTGCFRSCEFLWSDWLFPYIGKPFIVVAGEELGGDFPAEVTIDAGEIVVIFARNIERVFVGSICHDSNLMAGLLLR